MNLLRGTEIVEGTCLRVKKDERKPELHYYDIRHDDDCIGIACTIQRFVLINHLGTIATKQELPLDEFGQLHLTEEEGDIIHGIL